MPVKSILYDADGNEVADEALAVRGVTVEVDDDGRGGAELTPGGGLDGIRRRLAAFDGTVTVLSPRGGPTLVVMAVPCGSS